MHTLNILEGGGRKKRKREKEEEKGRGRKGERSEKMKRGGGTPSQGHGVENQKGACSSMGVRLAGRHGGNFLE